MDKASATLEAVRWHEWGDEAFRKAKDENKLILLGISATWCHWCHVMDRTSYSDPDVIGEISANFVPVRVDNDRRPDVNRRYNLGGWPTTAILTPEGELVTGGTYIPPDRLLTLLQRVNKLWRADPGDFLSLGRAGGADVEPEVTPLEEPEELEPALAADDRGRNLVEAADALAQSLIGEAERSFDARFGGFGREPKFPYPHLLRLLAEEAYRGGAYAVRGDLTGPGGEHLPEDLHRGEPPLGGDLALQDCHGLARIVRETLRGMSGGGLFDQVEGGFFRYSTTRDWSVPHFEKMLEDNAELLGLYLDEYVLTGVEWAREVAERVVAYTSTVLSAPGRGGFYGSQDADEEYYRLDSAGRRRTTPPGVDRTFHTTWNALVAASFLRAGVILGNAAVSSQAVKTLDYLLASARADDGSMYHYLEGGSPGLYGQLADQVEMARALITAFQHTGLGGYLSTARELAEWALANCRDADGAFFDAVEDPSARGALRRRVKPVEENAAMAEVLDSLATLTGAERYRAAAAAALARLQPEALRQGIMAAPLALALRRHVAPGPVVHIVGSRGNQATTGLWREALAAYVPGKIVELVETTDAARLAELGYPAEGVGRAYVCRLGACAPPVSEPGELRPLLSDGPAASARRRA